MATWISDNGVSNTVLLGGTAALAAGIEDQVPRGVRVAGSERTATAVAIATTLWQPPQKGERRYVVINGGTPNGWAFGLVAAGLGADADAPTVVVVGSQVSPATTELLTECDAKSVQTVTVGDTTVVSQAVRDQIETLDGAACEG